jgi:hypothetical protein
VSGMDGGQGRRAGVPLRRLGAEVFDLPVPEIRFGYRSAVYFSRA